MLSKLGAGLRSRKCVSLLRRRDVRRDVSHLSWATRARVLPRELPSETDAALGREFYDSCTVITVLFNSPSRDRRAIVDRVGTEEITTAASKTETRKNEKRAQFSSSME